MIAPDVMVDFGTRPLAEYEAFLAAKVPPSSDQGIDVPESAFSPVLKPHQRAIARWMVRGGRRACFAAFGLGKTMIQLEAVRVARQHHGGHALIVIPLGVRQAILKGRIGWGCELSAGYFADAKGYVEAAAAQRSMPSLFDLLEAEREPAA